MKSSTLIAVKWLWSNRGKDIWWTPGVLTADNPDPTSPHLTTIEAISIFEILHENGLIIPAIQNGQHVFLLHETKIQEWNKFIKELEHTENNLSASSKGLNEGVCKQPCELHVDQTPSPDGNDGTIPQPKNIVLLLVELGVVLWMTCDLFDTSIPLWRVGLLLMGISLILGWIAHTFSKKVWSNNVAVWIIYLFILVGLLAVVLISRPHKPTLPTPDFSIRVTWQQNETNFMRYIDDNGQIVPFAGAALVEFINLKSVPLMIDSYAIEKRTPDGRWGDADMIPKFGVNRGRILMGYNAYTNLNEWHYTSFDSAIQGKNITPNETVRGWLFFKSYFGGENPRFKMRDTLGNISAEPIQGGSGLSNGWPKQDLLEEKTNNSVDFRSLSVAPQ
jgi:hypothetical protein